MLDRTDLQLMLCEQIKDMPTDELVELLARLTGSELEIYDEAQDIVTGEIESLAVDDPSCMKTWLGFMLYALGERMENQEAASETD